MKKLNVMNKLQNIVGTVSFQAKKHSPEIFMVLGIGGFIGTVAWACYETTKLDTVMEKSNKNIEEVKKSMVPATVEDSTELVESPAGKKDLVVAYAKTGFEIAKLYAGPFTLGGLSIASVLVSNDILRKRYIATAAAYVTVDKAFKNYRERVIERFGEDTDRELRFNVKETEVDEVVVDENGEEVTAVKKVKTADISDFAVIFNKASSEYWDECLDYNLLFLNAKQAYANNLLKARKHLYLNDVFEMLGMDKTKAGQVVGWREDHSDPDSDNYIDFRVHVLDDETIILDFNVDGNIWAKM